MKGAGSITQVLFAALWGTACMLASLSASAQANSPEPIPRDPAGKHRGAVNALIYDAEGRILSAGADGFLGIWNPRNNRAEERFQLSPYALSAIALRPGAAQIALTESDGLGLYRISVWDYRLKQRLFTLRFRDPVSYAAYSGGGNFLMVSRSGRTGVVFLHPETGEVLRSPEDLTGSVSFAATGRSERTMIAYSPLGTLSYWELDSGAEIRRFSVSAGLASPILFGNNRFFGGIGAEGLVILDAVSGNTLIRESRISRAILLPGDEEQAEFLCLAVEDGRAVLYRYGISAGGRLETRERKPLPQDLPNPGAAAAMDTGVALGTDDGRVLIWASNAANPQEPQTTSQRRVSGAAVSGSIMAFITERGNLGFIPLDVTALRNHAVISLEDAEHYTHISADTGTVNSPETGFAGTFMLWRTGTARTYPQVRSVDHRGRIQSPPRILSNLPARFPLRSVSILDKKALFLDSAGNTTVIDMDSGNTLFSFSSAGSLDAAFLDPKRVIIGRSAVSGNTPFLLINIETGETVPLPYPAAAGVRVYRSSEGVLYGAVIDDGAGTVKTTMLRLDPANPGSSPVLAEYQGEDSGFSMAESGGALASTLGGDGAALYGPQGIIPFERSPGLPFQLIGTGPHVIIIDTEGGIGWYDGQTGKPRGLLRLYEKEWVLERPDGEPFRGSLELSPEL